MRNSLKTEFKTLLHMKSVWICFLVLLLVSMIYYIQSYSSAQETVTYDISIIKEIQSVSEDMTNIDYSNIQEDLTTIYKTYHPSMALNNSFGVLFGLGLIIVPIISSLFMGIEYSKNKAIKYKITHWTLLKTYLSKIVVLFSFIVICLMVYLIGSLVISHICWGSLLTQFSSISIVDFSKVSFFDIRNNAAVFLLLCGVFFFYACITMLITALSKSSTYGIIAVIAINYVVIPSAYTPHNIVFRLINETFYISSASPFEFVQTTASELSLFSSVLIFSLYLVLPIISLIALGVTQKNS